MASTKPLMVLFGATGVQGGAVISYFLSLNPQTYALRGITRNTESSTSKALVEKGVEMVAANLDDTSSLVKAFQGATAIFTVTDFWHPFYNPSNQEKAKQAGKEMTVWTYEYELQQGKNIFDAASQISTLERLIFSGLADATKWSGGKYSHVYHFISKAHAVEYAKETYPKLWTKTSVLQVGFYLSNILPGAQPLFSPRKDEEGYITFTPFGNDFELPMIAAEEDTGPLVHAILKLSPGKNLIGVRKWMKMSEFAEMFARVLNVKARIAEDSGDLFEGFPGPLRVEFEDTVGFGKEFGYDGGEVDGSVVRPRELGVPIELGTVEDWIANQDWSAVFKREVAEGDGAHTTPPA